MIVRYDFALELVHVLPEVVDAVLRHLGLHVACLFLALLLVFLQHISGERRATCKWGFPGS